MQGDREKKHMVMVMVMMNDGNNGKSGYKKAAEQRASVEVGIVYEYAPGHDKCDPLRRAMGAEKNSGYDV
ncbi:hypothetical protein N7539_009173 [Penicillium diatomitis]|uniref:Uncharacterized protein n=1 Tax=Penicillium diatomitis TaxID=2819901 RepID=A0A9W9WLA2_9EURO|nr:uncharacterized protein N7539_009173 [Penicillium diatomitis]KAJ5469555.1 hypothetical protein N7539_009173 [Penicillium diatomitis]